VVAPPPGNPRFPLLDPLRAVAALAIVVTHTAGYSGFNSGNFLGAWTARFDVGVTIFFVLSGFLLYRPFVAARLEGRPGPSVGRYARRRVLRIFPAYWVALIVLGLAVPQYLSKDVFNDTWWATFALVQSWDSSTILNGLSVAWSLSVEAMFYILLPFYALVMRRFSVRTELIVLVVSAVVAAVVRIIVRVEFPYASYANTLPGTWAWFAGGLALAVLSANGSLGVVRRHPYRFWAAAFVLLTISAWWVGLPRVWPSGYTDRALAIEYVLYLGVAVCLVAPATERSSMPLLGSRPLAWLGLVSYGIFLYHQVFVGAFRDLVNQPLGFGVYTLAVVAAAIACATLSYYLVERPILRFKEPQRARGTGGMSSRTRARAVASSSES
jgi:peptidoglycan/LPS O-acetylase OafA/YrhL